MMNFQDKTRTFMVVVDETPEFKIALYYAAIRAKKTDSHLAMLYVVEPEEFQFSLSVKQMMEYERRLHAENILKKYAVEIYETYGILPIYHILEGNKLDCLSDVLAYDKSISVLVLGAEDQEEGPGQLIIDLFSRTKTNPVSVPITIVPGHLTMEQLLEIA